MGEAILDGVRTGIGAGYAMLVPAAIDHDTIYAGQVPLKRCTFYALPNHPDAVAHRARDAAEVGAEHVDGKTTVKRETRCPIASDIE